MQDLETGVSRQTFRRSIPNSVNSRMIRALEVRDRCIRRDEFVSTTQITQNPATTASAPTRVVAHSPAAVFDNGDVIGFSKHYELLF